MKNSMSQLKCKEYSNAKFWNLYNENVPIDKKINYRFFSRIFKNNFNIDFASMVTHVCNYCAQISNAKENTDKNQR